MDRQLVLPKEKGSYILILKMGKSESIRIGRLGEIRFSKGYYAYVGSAMGPGGIAARVNHHLRASENPHWHIDYLTRCAKIVEVWYRKGEKRFEHDWAAVIDKIQTSAVPAKRLGSTDCRCRTHLYYFQKKPEFKVFQKNFNRNFMPEHLLRVKDSGKGDMP